MWRVFAVLLPLLLVGCSGNSPGDQCLASFKSSLKDPESGKVISFKDGELIYTATNSYGARTQGRALCVQVGEEWVRNPQMERLAVLEHTKRTLETYNACVRGGRSSDECAGGSLALKLRRSDGHVDLNELTEESAKALGY